MLVFGSYIGKERSLTGESVNILVLDTFVAFSCRFDYLPGSVRFLVRTLPRGRGWSSLFFRIFSTV
ncbi:MAG: hypothetical protein U5P10_08415 [Spirochaetia bacterium]|nr:hypothetical protein [Spirochaetia bacterium]